MISGMRKEFAYVLGARILYSSHTSSAALYGAPVGCRPHALRQLSPASGRLRWVVIGRPGTLSTWVLWQAVENVGWISAPMIDGLIFEALGGRTEF